jgi:hypothetical protein
VYMLPSAPAHHRGRARRASRGRSIIGTASLAMCPGVPMPADAMLVLPGLDVFNQSMAMSAFLNSLSRQLRVVRAFA